MSKENLRQGKRFGKLYPEEIKLAREVFKDTLPYERIFIANISPNVQGITVATSPFRKRANYLLLWSNAYKTNIAESNERMKQTFIHELVHVWQGQYWGFHGMSYMWQSVWHQLHKGVKDIFKNGFREGSRRLRQVLGKNFTREWGFHRNMAYCFYESEIGRDFKTFNVEQQALIIESWFAKQAFTVSETEYFPGYQFKSDPRFPYVRDCLREKNPRAEYVRWND